ncbi:MAG: class I SAM-dependent methyltransferase, partial [Fimbriimonadaceae bacterium]|nr:class I SAM-dependent methyltransferase [Alphaproteobacteria bacterium]
LGGYVRLGTEFATEDHRYCHEAFATGAAVPFQGRSKAFSEAVAQSTAGLQVLSAKKLLPELPGLNDCLAAGGTLLEVGCGEGRLLLQLTRSFPEARCIGADIDPTGLEIARKAIREAGAADRVSLVEGDVAAVVEPDSVDAVVMIEVLHEIQADVRQHLIAACYRALRQGGWMLIVDETYPSTLADARKPEFLFPVQTGFEELTWGNVIPTREDQEALLRGAGFANDVERSLIGEGFTVLAVRK